MARIRREHRHSLLTEIKTSKQTINIFGPGRNKSTGALTTKKAISEAKTYFSWIHTITKNQS